MRQNILRGLTLALVVLCLGSQNAQAACTVPNELTNGQTADASQVMANFNSVLSCVNATPTPGGSTNSLQYNGGSGTLGGVAPLTNGQIAVGVTGGPPQGAQITAGTRIAISNDPGSITISSASSPYKAPLIANFTWGNQPTGTTGIDSNTGFALYQPEISGNWDAGVLWDKTSLPSATAFTITIGLDVSLLTNGISMAGITMGDGTGKFIMFDIQPNGGYVIGVNYMNSYTSYTGSSPVATPISQNVRFLEIKDDLTNFTFYAGADINSLVPVGTLPATAFIGAATQVGLFGNGYSQPIGSTFFEYSRSDGAT